MANYTKRYVDTDQFVEAIDILDEFADRLSALSAYPPILPVAGNMLKELITDAKQANALIVARANNQVPVEGTNDRYTG